MSSQATVVGEEAKQYISKYMKSDGPGGQKIIDAFMEEFSALSNRAPKDDPTNVINHLGFLKEHIITTWDSSFKVSDDGHISIGICTDDTLGFTEDREKLKHNPVPTAWIVYLIRGIAGKYAFVNPEMYQTKKKEPMPSQYHHGFLISKNAWVKEGWYTSLGDFSRYEHPASGASTIPFFDNVMNKIDMRGIVAEALKEYEESRK